ncbi:hypothetical protein EOK75_20495 (plasmid) [Pseudorhodobacter turbinis]|uniref:Uncharacterized protein n=1 Tax=Pseudorhodobacter turbinis TaxID=2500533 RepID=A0A4P8ELZ4_9RHOB|nr:hypothetical protein EOK75_20495 [Pseudorhodobacter turbinis]
MVLGFLACGVALGAVSAITVFTLGYGILLGLLAYMLGGTLGTIVAVMMALRKQQKHDRLVVAES